MPIEEASLRLVESKLGFDFVSYCTASSRGDVSMRFKGEKPLSGTAESALVSLADLCSELVRRVSRQNMAANDGTVHSVNWSFFANFDTARGMTLANAFRKEAGGQIFAPRNGSGLVPHLQKIAASVFPILLIPVTGDLPGEPASLTGPIMSYSESRFAAAAILSDPDLCRLCPRVAGDDEADPKLDVFLSHSVIENIVTYAFNKLVLSLRALPSIEDLCSAIPDSVSTARDLVQGKQVSLPVLVGLGNIKLPEGAVVETQAGCLSEYLKIYERWSPWRLRGTRTVHNSDRGRHEFIRAGNIVLRVDERVRVRMADKGAETGTPWTMNSVDTSAIVAAESTVFLAATLGIDNDPPVAVYPTWSIRFSPLMADFAIGRDAIEKRAIAPLLALTDEETAAWGRWISKISSIGLKGVEVAARRIQLAIAERDSPLDRFVDSIIAWENIFGGGSEMTLRISASLALLLGKDSGDRRRIYDEARKLYTLRGKVVHGADTVKDKDLPASAATGLRAAIDAMRKLYEELPDMVPLTGEKRSLAMILQARYVDTDEIHGISPFPETATREGRSDDNRSGFHE